MIDRAMIDRTLKQFLQIRSQLCFSSSLAFVGMMAGCLLHPCLLHPEALVYGESNFRGGTARTKSAQPVRSHRLADLPLSLRRVGAWAIEITLVAASAIVPLELGMLAKHHTGELVPLNPVLSATEETIAQTLAMPIGDDNQQVAPLTNLLWSGAIVLPIVLAGSQLYLLAKTGSTLPKRWLGVQVTTATGAPPGVAKVLLREGLGRWGLPVGTAYLIWRYSGAFPGLGILASLSALLMVGEAAIALRSRNGIALRSRNGIALQNRDRQTGHDRLAGTYAIDAFSPIWQPAEPPLQAVVMEADDWVDGAITAIVLQPESRPTQQGLWLWMRRHPGTLLVGGLIVAVGLILSTFVGTIVYVQSQANDRNIRQQRDQMFLAIVNQLATRDRPSERQAAVLTLASIDDPRSPALLSDLLAQETSAAMLNAIEQALLSSGTETLPALRKLNQAMRSELASAQGTPQAGLVALRLRTTQQRSPKS
ncbi:MAG: RDD family protein [Leptolyngbyaceae cyanobacterium SM1_3_5]|nr:RDD family protein [Leptolyngbyaceae cyanobacterium SM1_3_5]